MRSLEEYPVEVPAESAVRWPLWARLLAVPLFYKILAANAVIVLLFSLLAMWLTVQLVASATPLSPILVVALSGAVVSLAVNALLIKLALEPLLLLKRTAVQVQEGQVEARVPESPLADRDMRALMQATNAMLDRLADYRTRLREVAARALEAAEEERRRISLELHDDTSQRLAAILMRLRLARGVGDPGAKDEVLEEVRREVAEAADGLRRYAQGLRPPALDELGLGPAIESHVRHISEGLAVPVQVRTDGVGRLESAEAELALYRIVQEAINNAVRHSKASSIEVLLERRDDTVVAVIRDHGVGFEARRLLDARGDERRGLGLFGMRERAGYVGGRVEIESESGVGTTVTAAIPAGGAMAPRSAAVAHA